jgi:hypothetical protein
VRREAAGLGLVQQDQVQCVDPALLPLADQVAAAAKATLLVAHHGTVSYAALFAREGAALLSAGQPPLKEAHVLLWAAHVQTFFLAVDRLDSDLAPLLLLSLCRAGASFGFACPPAPPP